MITDKLKTAGYYVLLKKQHPSPSHPQWPNRHSYEGIHTNTKTTD